MEATPTNTSDAVSSPGLATLRVTAVICLAAIVVAYSLPDLRGLWQPRGWLGVAADGDNVVNLVVPGSPADQAGIKLGDRFDMAATGPEGKFAGANGGGVAAAGQRISFVVVQGTHERVATLVSIPFDVDTAARLSLVGRELVMLVFVIVGAALVLLRPSIATWGFYFYCLGVNGAPSQLAPALLPSPWNWLTVLTEYWIGTAGIVGVAVFAIFFLHEPPSGWRVRALRALPAVLLVTLGLQTYGVLGPNLLGWRANAADNLLIALSSILAVVAAMALVSTYVSSRGSDRQRIRWVVVGIVIALAAAIVLQFPAFWISASRGVLSVFELVGVVVPLTVAYAVIKHHVIDVNFVVSRTLVYGALTSLLVGIFALIDWLFIDNLKLVRLGTIAELAVAVASGFWFNALHKRVDAFIDATFFRRRRRAELQLARSAAALPLAPTVAAIAHFLIDEPVRAMSLASAALFRRNEEGVFTREASEGWDEAHTVRLSEDDIPLLMLAQSENGPLSLYDHPWRSIGVPGGPARPVLALPIAVRGELVTIVFYGSHVHGEALDPDEIAAIAGLATGAAAAYDHVAAEAMKHQVESMKTQIAALESRLAEAQIQPA